MIASICSSLCRCFDLSSLYAPCAVVLACSPNHVSLGGVRTLYERRHLADHLSAQDENKAAMYRYIRRVAQALTVHMGAPSLDGTAAASESKQLIFKSPLHRFVKCGRNRRPSAHAHIPYGIETITQVCLSAQVHLVHCPYAYPYSLWVGQVHLVHCHYAYPYSLWVGALLREFPDAQLLLLHRSPVAVVTSWLAFALANV